MSTFIWVLPIAGLVFLILSVAFVSRKSKRLNREILKLGRRRNQFFDGLPKAVPITPPQDLPSLPSARAKRRLVVRARTQKRRDRQRRLVEHLKDLQKKESE